MKKLKLIKLFVFLASIKIVGNLFSGIKLERVNGKKIEIKIPKDEIWSISDLKEAEAKKLNEDVKKIHLMRIRQNLGRSELYENKNTEPVIDSRPKIVITDEEKDKAKNKFSNYILVFQ
jgi:hypothetical protein